MEVTYSIIIFTVVVSVFCFNDRRYFDLFKFNAYDVKHGNQWYRFFSYGFLHANWVHLIINMVVLFSFGKALENLLRGYFYDKYILFYILLYIGGLLLSIMPAYGKHKNDVFYNSVGASGAIASVIFATIAIFPQGKVSLFFFPVPIASPIFGVIYLAYEFYMSKKANDNIGHDAHFWGAVYGIIFVGLLKLYTIAYPPQHATEFLQYLHKIF